jgi:hypothetical protein
MGQNTDTGKRASKPKVSKKQKSGRAHLHARCLKVRAFWWLVELRFARAPVQITTATEYQEKRPRAAMMLSCRRAFRKLRFQMIADRDGSSRWGSVYCGRRRLANCSLIRRQACSRRRTV